MCLRELENNSDIPHTHTNINQSYANHPETAIVALLFISFHEYFKLFFTFYMHDKNTRNTKANLPPKQDIYPLEENNFKFQNILSEILYAYTNVSLCGFFIHI